MNKYALIIPARKGSSYHRKNLKLLNGLSLVRHALESCNISQPHDTIVSTDDHYVQDECLNYSVTLDERPQNLANDLATLDNVIHYIANTYTYDTYVLLPPTSPLRTFSHVENAIKLFEESKADSLISVTQELKSIWKKDDDGFLRPLVERSMNRQQSEPVYIANGAIFISKRENILKSKKKVSGHTIEYVMSMSDSVDIHNQDDLKLAEYLIKERG